MKLLLAEDNPLARSSMESLVSQWGYEVTAVSNGAEAWEVLQQPAAPKLALLDWMMPVMEGLEVCQRARQHFRQNPPYLILLTGRNSEEDLVAGLASGADEYIVKPVSIAELKARLHAGQRIVELRANLTDRVRQLEEAVVRVKQLHGLLPICSYCKKIRDDHNYWRQVEEYISAHSETQFSHSICPDCYQSIVLRQLGDQVPHLEATDSPSAKSDTTSPEKAEPQAEDPSESPEPIPLSHSPPLDRGECRSQCRYRCNWETPYRLNMEIGTARVRDLSTGGIRLELSHQVEMETPMSVELFNKAGNYWHVKQIRLVHAEPASEQRWVVGSEFLRELSPNQLREVLK